MAVNFNWTCPHCLNPQIVTDSNYHNSREHLSVGENSVGFLGTQTIAIACQNQQCRKVYLHLNLHHGEYTGGAHWKIGKKIEDWILVPESRAKPQPEFIPAPLRADYFEACRIRDLSPKASATLARRCLQGMIRDFCGIAKGRLTD